MLDSREYEGYWWLPERPDDKVVGTLYFSQDDVRLELLGAFSDSPAEPDEEGAAGREVTVVRAGFGELPDRDRIIGIIRGQQFVTLERCQGFGVSLGIGPLPVESGLTTTTYRPGFVLVGARYDPDEDVAFDEVSMRFSDLEMWAGRSGLTQDFAIEDGHIKSVQVNYTPLDPIEVRIDDDATLKIEFPWGHGGTPRFEAHITQAASFRVCFDTPASIERALTYVTQLRGFLALAVGRPIRVLSVTGHHNPDPAEEPDPFTRLKPSKISVELLYRMVGLPDEPTRQLRPGELLFTLDDALPRLEEILKTWFEQQEHLGPVLLRYFHLVHNPVSSREQEFESLVRVLETHHRRVHGAAGVDEAHRARLDRIYSGIEDEDDQKWLKSKLAFSHEPTLRDRLRDVVDRCPTISATLIGSAEEIAAFIKLAGDTRNYETHLDPSLEGKSASGVELVALVYQLRALVQMTLLLDIGFTCDQIDTTFAGMTRRYAEVQNLREQSS
jgi:ApeA N-terminal domain 1/Apea-like HEPN